MCTRDKGCCFADDDFAVVAQHERPCLRTPSGPAGQSTLRSGRVPASCFVGPAVAMIRPTRQADHAARIRWVLQVRQVARLLLLSAPRVVFGTECNRPGQVPLVPEKLRVRAPILCPRLGCTEPKQAPLCEGRHQKKSVSGQPQRHFSVFGALHRTRQTATNECISRCISSCISRLDGAPFLRIGVLEPARLHGINWANRHLTITFHHIHFGVRTARSRRSCPSQLAGGRPRVRRPWQGTMGCHSH